MKAWGNKLDADKTSGLRFLGDASGAFTRAWDVEFDATELMGLRHVVTKSARVHHIA